MGADHRRSYVSRYFSWADRLRQYPPLDASNIGATAVRNSTTTFVAKRVQRIWPPVMMGIIFVLEAAWILFLLYLSIALTRLAAVVLRRRGVHEVAQVDF
jgi:hypothetical protein